MEDGCSSRKEIIEVFNANLMQTGENIKKKRLADSL